MIPLGLETLELKGKLSPPLPHQHTKVEQDQDDHNKHPHSNREIVRSIEQSWVYSNCEMLPGSSALGEENILGLDPCSLGVAPQNQSDIFPRPLIPLFGSSFFAPNPRLAKSKDALEKICPIWRLSSLLCLLPAWGKLGEEEFRGIFISKNHDHF